METKIIVEEDYKTYFGVNTAPNNLIRLEFISLETLKAIPMSSVPTSIDDCYSNFKYALLEQINFFNINSDLLDEAVNQVGATLGKYSEGSKEIIKANSIIKFVSPMAYNILLNCGLLYVGLC